MALGEGAKVAQLFTDDRAFSNKVIGEKPNISVCGRKQFDELYPSLKRETALPCIHNHIIEINGNDATGTCTIKVRITRNNQSIIGLGYHADIYRPVDGQWKFGERRCHFHHFVPLLKAWAEKAWPISR